MAEVILDYEVIKSTATTINEASKSILSLYQEMLSEVKSTGSRMKGNPIDIEVQQFASMQPVFETFAKDMAEYSKFLMDVADEFKAVENEGTQEAQEQGKVF